MSVCVTCGCANGVHVCACGFECKDVDALHQHLSTAHLRSGNCRLDKHARPSTPAPQLSAASALAASAAAYAVRMRLEKKRRTGDSHAAAESPHSPQLVAQPSPVVAVAAAAAAAAVDNADVGDDDDDSAPVLLPSHTGDAAAAMFCATCGFGGDRHVCTCSREFDRRSILYLHIDGARPSALCHLDRHRQDDKDHHGACDVCGELFEVDLALKSKHTRAHVDGLYWCALCQKAIAGKAIKIERHFAEFHAPIPDIDGTPPPHLADSSPPPNQVASPRDDAPRDVPPTQLSQSTQPHAKDAVPPPPPLRQVVLPSGTSAAATGDTKTPPKAARDEDNDGNNFDSDMCDICGTKDQHHYCSCGLWRVRIGSLITHIVEKPRNSNCSQDPHIAMRQRPGACSVCGEILEADPEVRARHVKAHETDNSFWCPICAESILGSVYGEWHFMTFHRKVEEAADDADNAGATPHKKRKIAARVRKVVSNGSSRLLANGPNAASTRRASAPVTAAPVTRLRTVTQRLEQNSSASMPTRSAPLKPVAVALDLYMEPDGDRAAVGGGDDDDDDDDDDDGSGADVCSFVSDGASCDVAPASSKQCTGTRIPHTPSACRVCGHVDGAHECACGQAFSRASVLHAHIALRGGDACKRDPHLQGLGRDGTCGVCGELLDADDRAREQHEAMHKIGLFWCGDCRKPLAMRMKMIKEHYGADDVPSPRAAANGDDAAAPSSPLRGIVDAGWSVDEDDHGGARERMMEVDDHLQGLTDMAEQLAVFTSTLYARGEEVRRALEPVAGASHRNRTYADELLGGVQNFRSADHTRSFVAYAMVPADALVDVRLSHDRRAVVLSYSAATISANDISTAMPHDLPVHIQQALANRVCGVVADSLSRRTVSMRLRLAHAVNLATFRAWKVCQPSATKVLFFSGAYDFAERAIRVGNDAM